MTRFCQSEYWILEYQYSGYGFKIWFAKYTISVILYYVDQFPSCTIRSSTHAILILYPNSLNMLVIFPCDGDLYSLFQVTHKKKRNKKNRNKQNSNNEGKNLRNKNLTSNEVNYLDACPYP